MIDGYFGVVKASSISSLLQKQRREGFDGPLVRVETRGFVELDIM